MSNVIASMGQVAKESMDLYYGDLVHDGLCLQKYGLDRNYLWMIRSAGTHIVCLDRLDISDNDPELFDTLIGQNERFFLMGKIGTGADYFQEIDAAHAYRVLMNCTVNLLEVDHV